MSQQVDTSPKGYAASMKPHHRFLSLSGNALQWVGAYFVCETHGWHLLLPYLVILFIFTYFLGIPPFVNILRCAKACEGIKSHLALSLAMQGAWVAVMYLLLATLKVPGLFPFFVILGIVRAFSMPRDQLMQERVDFNNTRTARRGDGPRYFRSIPDKRLGAPNWNKPWTPPDNFPRARFFRRLKQAHPEPSNLDAAFLIEETIYFYDDFPVKEPKRTEHLLQRVESEIEQYCSWSTQQVTGWGRNPVGTGMSRSSGRNPWLNDRWLLRRIQDELKKPSNI